MIDLLGSPIRKIREINQRYSHPRIQQSRMVKISLLFLRIYLLVLVAILFYKFVTTIRGG